ncbi:MAG: discoidin domain-containing protein, partial [Candidatus Hydrogenedentota bacterium]
SKGSGGTGKVYIDELELHTLSEKEVAAGFKITAKASSIQEEAHKAEYAVDNNKQTRWSSQFSDDQWLEIDFGEIKEMIGLTLFWETAYGKSYEISLSSDGKNWETVYSTTDGDGCTDDIYFKKRKARYIKIYGKERGTGWGYSLWEVVLKYPEEQPVISASSFLEDNKPENIFDGDMKTEWITKPEEIQWIEVDLRKIKEIGGLFLYWNESFARTYEIWASNNRKEWSKVYSISNGNGECDMIYIDKIPVQFIKIELKESANKKGYGLKEITLKGPDEFLTTQKYYETSAIESPKGYFPRWVYKEQGFWTVVGMDEDFKESLFCEDGSLEPYKSFSIIPFLYIDNKLITWADVELSQSLEKDYIPVPTVQWKYKDIIMNIKPFAYGKPGESTIYILYKIENKSKKSIKGKLFLTVRPFEINPPWQWGGLHKIYNIKYTEKNIIEVDKFKIYPLTEGFEFGCCNFKDRDIVYSIEKGNLPEKKSMQDKNGYASGTLEYKYELNPDAKKDFFVAIPLYENSSVIKDFSQINKMLNETIKFWETKLNKIEINIPDTDIVNTLKANLAYILINKDGPAIQPGSRCYEAAWMRDGTMTALALLRMGFTKEIKEYIDWYSKFLYKDGRVPAIVIINRNNEINPVKEYDSQGQLIFAILNYYYFTKDKNFLEEKLPVVIQVLKYLEYLRDMRLTDEYKNNPELYGILPNSVSHEGYYPEPGKHSYWDDFWALKGWKDARQIAEILGRDDLLDWINKEEQELRESVYNSIKYVMKNKKIDYIPGCAELGDFDATSTAIAVMCCGELEYLPQVQLKRTFDKYFDDVLKRLEPDWKGGFTPYEIRSVQAFLFMNQKEKALKLIKFLLSCRRPTNWNHWAEVVYSPPRQGCYIGDMPHTWVGSGYINTAISLFVFEKDESLILGAGIDEEWLERKEGVSVKNMPTYFGKISYSVTKEDEKLKIIITGDAKPDKGFVLKSPFLKKKINKVKINNREWKNFSESEVSFDKLPAEIEIN